MSYQVLARKWRPRRFSELVGQEHVVRALSNALDTGRMHHAYLFTGTRGVGKTTIARILAKSINCEQGMSAQPCGECAICQAVDAGRFVDLLEIDAASNTSVDDVREVIENAQYAPARGRYKVYLVDEVHMLSKSAFNALLKTLEEPPPHVEFLLATTDPQKLPATVLSRCLKFDLKRLLPEQIDAQLRHILDAEAITHDDDSLAELARAADGSLRDGLSLLDQALAYGDGGLQAEPVRSMLGTVERNRLAEILDALSAGDGKAMTETCAQMAEFSPDFGGVLDALAGMLHRIQLHQLVDGYRDTHADAEAAARFADSFSAEDVQLYYQLALTGQREMTLAPDTRTGFEMTLLRMLAFRPETGEQTANMTRSTVPAPAPARAPRSQAEGGASAATTAPAPAPTDDTTAAPAAAGETPAQAPEAAAPAPQATAPDANPDTLDWAGLIEKADLHGPLRQLAVNATLQSLEQGRMTLALPAAQGGLAVEPLTGQLQDKLSAALGRSVKLRFVHADGELDTPAARERAASDARQAQAERAIDADPTVQSLKRDFGATVVPQSVRPHSPEPSNPSESQS